MNTYKIGILIPVYNEEVVIKGTIQSLLDAGAAHSDIYIVNDKSTDLTQTVAESTGVNVYTVDVNGGKATAQKKALKYFRLTDRYDWIIFLDGDTKVDINFFKEINKAIVNDPTVALYVGQVKSVKNNHIYSANRAMEYTYGQDVAKQGQSNFNAIFVSPGCASVYKCDVLKDLDIDHMTLAEDMDLTMQVHRKGGRVVYVPGASVNTQDPSTFKDYNKQILRWYRGMWQITKKHGIFNFSNNSRVDWYMRFIIFDALFFNQIVWMLGFLIVAPSVALYAFGLNIIIAFVIAIYAAIRTKRLDVVYKFPVYFWLSYVNFYAYIRAFIEIVIQKKELLAWNKVKRYEFDSK